MNKVEVVPYQFASGYINSPVRLECVLLRPESDTAREQALYREPSKDWTGIGVYGGLGTADT